MPIHVLPTEVATRIAAGEVVERPASVIKELIENAIDAAATAIRVEIQSGGIKMMRVTDDGCGIPSQEVELAFARHSTSKLNAVEDLEHIQTLGFRGEALASIASVARVTLQTHAQDEAVGTALKLEGGQITSREPSGRPTGTTITVRDLFYNVPARRKFLRTERTERRHIDVLMTRYAMAYPQLRFILNHDGRTTFQSNGSGDLREVLVSVYGGNHAAQMIPVATPATADQDGIQVEGYASMPSLHRSNRSEITLFVNGRWVQDSSLTVAVTQAYHTLLMTKRYPLAVLKIQLPPENLDVNVHPAKTQVRFRDGDSVFRAVQRTVRHALLHQTSTPGFSPVSGQEEPALPVAIDEQAWPGGWPSPEQLLRRAQLRALGSRQFSPSTGRPQEPQFRFDLPRPAENGTSLSGITPGPPAQGKLQTATAQARAAGAQLEDETRPGNQLPLLRVVGQLGLTYIVAEGPGGMFLIDQHAAHERVLYERLMAEKAEARAASQALLEPLPIELSAEGSSMVEEQLEALLALGFNVEPFGGNTLLVRAVPAMLVGDDIQSTFDEIVADLQVGDEPLASEMEARITSRVCKRAAIKAGQALSRQEMDQLIRQLEACISPHSCPHGRPTMIHLSAVQLAQEFGRLG
jgi:DNA mismatch repair protein MutL